MPEKTIPVPGNEEFDVRAFGAVGDGRTINTEAIQRAFDACSNAGGGVVRIASGTFVSGTLYLRDGVHLHLARGAVLKASPRRADYNRDDAFPQNTVCRREAVSGAHFLLGVGIAGVTLSGDGVIDGNDEVFRGPLQDPENADPKFGFSEWRPGQMIYFCESRDIRIEGLTIRHAPYWHLFLHGCADIRIHGLRMYGDRRTRNGDGIDLDCCVRAVVSDCLIDTSDDCITVRASGASLRHTPLRSEQIAVTNCVLRSRTCGVRIGVGGGVIRHIVCSNLVMRDVQSGIHVQGCWSPASEGVQIESIRFQNISIDGRVAFHITTGFKKTKPIRRIFLSGIDARCDSASYIAGSPLCPVEDVFLDDIHLTMHGGEDNSPDTPSPYETYEGAGAYSRRAYGMTCAAFLEYAKAVRIRRMTIRWRDVAGPWEHAVRCRDVEDLELREVETEPVPGGASPGLRLEEAHAVRIRECRGLE